jgi:hypothetical protein
VSGKWLRFAVAHVAGAGGDKKSRELYVGNVPIGLSADQLKQLLAGVYIPYTN